MEIVDKVVTQKCVNDILSCDKEKTYVDSICREFEIDINKDENLRHYVVWSGGCDSTLLLYILSKYINKNNITLISCIPNFLNHIKIKKEKEARKKILDKINLHIDKLIEIEYNFDMTLQARKTICTTGISQPQAWLLQALPFIDCNSIVHFGYIMSDCFWRYNHEFKEIFKIYNSMVGNKNVNLAFDIQYMEKTDVIKALQKIDLFNDIWYCESPLRDTEEPCGICHSCKEVQNALTLLNNN